MPGLRAMSFCVRVPALVEQKRMTLQAVGGWRASRKQRGNVYYGYYGDCYSGGVLPSLESTNESAASTHAWMHPACLVGEDVAHLPIITIIIVVVIIVTVEVLMI